MIQLNINDIVKVKLTAHGAEVYDLHQAKYYTPRFTPPRLFCGDILETKLWHLMQIFGSQMYNGAQQCFKDNKIIKED